MSCLRAPPATPAAQPGSSNGQYYGGFGGAPHGYGGRAAPPRVQEQTQRTSTIRNNVNLKKPTLKLVDAGNGKLAAQFTFDAAAPCEISVFVAANEHADDKFKVVPTHLAAPKRHKRDKGLGQVFLLPAEEAFDPADYTESELTEIAGTRIPLIVRLETVAEGETRSLPEPPGAAQPPWVQSQTTYATLTKKDNGSYDVQIERQKIWVDSVSYELQEIYGIEPSAATGMPVSMGDDSNGRECVVCLSEPRDTTVLPCRHMCMCSGCARMLRHQSNRCPICRTPVESLLEIKVDHSQQR